MDDLAEGLLYLLELDNPPDWVNVGCGEDISIRELAELVKEVTSFEGDIELDTSKPDGTPRKLMDSSLIQSLGWKPRISLRDGISSAYSDFLNALESKRLRC